MDGLKEYISIRKGGSNSVFKRLSYASFVLNSFPILYVETPKCACSTMKHVFCYLDGKKIEKQHVGNESSMTMAVHSRAINPVANLSTIENIKEYLTTSATVRFCIVRNPYARLASAWSDKVRQREPGYIGLWENISLFHNKEFDFSSPSCPSFKEFVNWLVNTQNPESCNVHWRPMNKLLFPKLINYTHILKTENLVSGFQAVLDAAGIPESSDKLLSGYRTNESLPVDWKSLYDDDLALMVYKHFKRDFELYEYSQDSWKRVYKEQSLGEENSNLKQDYQKLYNAALESIRNRNEVIEYLANKKDQVYNKKKQVLVIGDSHAEVFQKEQLTSKTPAISWDVVSVPGGTLSGLSNPNSKTQAMPVFNWALLHKKFDSVVFQLGEVDLGFVIFYRAERDNIEVSVAVEKALDNYKLLISLALKKSSAIVMSTCVPTIADGDSYGAVKNARRNIKATQEERTLLTLQFNQKLKKWCIEQGVIFVSFDRQVVGENGLIKPEFLNKNKADHHYDKTSFIKLINSHLFPELRKLLWTGG